MTASTNDDDKEQQVHITSDSDSNSDLSDEDVALLNEIASVLSSQAIKSEIVEQTLLQYVPRMPPKLIMTLRKAAADSSSSSAPLNIPDRTDSLESKLVGVGTALTIVLDSKLQSGKDLLADLLRCGEIRKLDGAIGKAAREGNLNMAFFTVLNMNINDAYQEKEDNNDGDDAAEDGADRLSILRHIYTRCQEEMEKTVNPGVGLLNKLLRTEAKAIRANQLRHYLAAEKQSVTTPDGTVVPLQGVGKALVPPPEFIDAVGAAVKQIRSVEEAGATDRVTAANLVESCRQVAIEAMIAVQELYGEESDELRDFQEKLQPVFRPGTTLEE
eukprot:CAMPEP_0195512860 /NCGR_PEP_ID=MMETSP0794_2-20130614/4672_1 /TAXON_ID=515487 /ORGANISM="Stephanopyxis turris, Strain CCMP 815" /LENGTH=328 /DNA_ID=CAMNT_0040640739 /DNA_START=285 /DNA_END=1271 /DNA_ORIENTATION=-